MKYLTINHYNEFEFELSYSLNGTFHKDIYVSFDPTDNSLYGLPVELSEYEQTIIDMMLEDYGDVIEEVSIIAGNEYGEYVTSIRGY